MAVNRKLGILKPDPTAVLFRLIESRLRSDPVLGQVVKTWQTWEGVPGDKIPPAPAMAPWVSLTPQPTAEDFWSPETQSGWLTIRIDTLVPGTCVDDVLNLWGAFRSRLCPSPASDGAGEFYAALKTAGAKKGRIRMSQPLFDPSSDAGQDGAFRAVGSVSVEYWAVASS